MHELVHSVLNSDEKLSLRQLIDALRTSGKQYFLRNEILQTFADYCHQFQKPAYFYHSSSLGKLLHHTHEIILEEENIWFVVRPWIASQQVWRVASNLSH
jgi:sucrose synthase